MFRATVIAILAGFMSSAVAQTPAPDLPAGVWQSPGFGYIARIDRRRVRTFEVSTAGCVRGPTYTLTAFRELYGSVGNLSGEAAVLHRGQTRDFLTRLPALPQSCTRPLRGRDDAMNFNVFAATFADYYAFFPERGVDWNSAVTRARETRNADLFDSLSALVAPLRDGHVSIAAGDRTVDDESVIAPGFAPDGSAWSWRTLRASLRDHLQGPTRPLIAPAALAGNRRILYGRTPDNIGYIAILGLGAWAEGQTEETPAAIHTEAAAEVMDAILMELSGVRGIIVDLRVNSGGFDTVSLEIASRFADTRRVAFLRQARRDASPRYEVLVEPSNRQRFEQPVAVLIGPNTVSAGESAALAFAALPHARLFGQPTRGILSDAIPKVLPNGWEFTLSVETFSTPEGETVEVRGVQPDEVTIPADGATMWSADIERARAWLVQRH